MPCYCQYLPCLGDTGERHKQAIICSYQSEAFLLKCSLLRVFSYVLLHPLPLSKLCTYCNFFSLLLCFNLGFLLLVGCLPPMMSLSCNVFCLCRLVTVLILRSYQLRCAEVPFSRCALSQLVLTSSQQIPYRYPLVITIMKTVNLPMSGHVVTYLAMLQSRMTYICKAVLSLP